MTDQEINRAVAEARGATFRGPGVVGAWEERDLDVCTDPAAWGALLEELKNRGLVPSLAALYDGTGYTATVFRNGWTDEYYDAKPGRALALVFLGVKQA